MGQSPLYAAIDLGSNSFHMLVVREVAGSVQTVTRVKRKVRLAAGLDNQGNLDHSAMLRGWQCLQLFAEQLRGIPAANVVIVGTATLRLAKNVDVFIDHAEEILNHSISIISGEQEARTIYQGVACTSAGKGRRLVIDIGGASTELIIGEGADVLELCSLDMGCVTWRSQFFADEQLNTDNFAAAIKAAKKQIAPVLSRFAALGWQNVHGASGTVQALQAMLIARGERETITLDGLHQLQQDAIACGTFAHLTLNGLSDERAPVFPSGLAILTAIFELLNIDGMTLAGGALREGLVNELLGQQSDGARRRTMESLQTRFSVDRPQAERVQQLAQLLLTQLPKEVRPAANARALLKWTCLVHEIGLAIEYRKAPSHGAYIVRESDMPGFTHAQQQLIALLISNQRDRPDFARFRQQYAIDEQQAISLSRVMRIALSLSVQRNDELPKVQLHAQQQNWKLVLPDGWLAKHPLRASVLLQEGEWQTDAGYSLQLCSQDQLGLCSDTLSLNG